LTNALRRLSILAIVACLGWVGIQTPIAAQAAPNLTTGSVPLALARTTAPFGPFIEAAKPIATSGTLKILNGPYLQYPTEGAVTIIWRTNRPCVSRVEYGPGFGRTAFSSRDGLVDANTTLHKIRVTGLAPGTPYPYRIVSTEIAAFQPYEVAYGETVASGPYEFTTLDRDKSAYSFVVLNDRHEKVAELEKALASVNWEGVDLVFLNGDMLNHVELEDQVFTGFVDACVNAFAKRIPFLYVRGNHETRGQFARSLLGYFATPRGRWFYSFNHGPVHFIVLDSGEDKEDSHAEYSGLVDFDRYRDLQAEWLKRDLASEAFRRARFRVVFVHIPLETAREHGFEDIRAKWGPLLDAAPIDLMLSGHTHHFTITERQADSGGGCPILIGGINTVIRVDVSGDRLKTTVGKDDGTTAVEEPLLVGWHDAERRLGRLQRQVLRTVRKQWSDFMP
jgi:predicted phosphodiesterase